MPADQPICISIFTTKKNQQKKGEKIREILKEKGSKLEYIPNERRTGDKQRKTDGSTIRVPKNNKEKPLFSPVAASSFFSLPGEKIREGKKRRKDREGKKWRETTNTMKKGRERGGGGGGDC